MASHAAHKRLACDRCRSHKLRCPRTGQSTEPCGRCQRAGAECKTGSARPIGRPRAPPIPPALFCEHGHPAALAAPPPTHGTRDTALSTPDADAQTGTAMTASTASPQPRPWPMQIDYLPDLLDSPPPPWETTMDHMFGSQIFDGGAMASPSIFTDLQYLDPSLDHQFPTHRSFDTDIAPVPTAHGALARITSTRSSSNNSSSSTNDANDSPGTDDDDGTGIGTGRTGALIGLSRLNESVARQLAAVDTFPWAQPDTIDACSGKLDSSTENPLASALKSVAQFHVILGSLSPSSGLPDSDPLSTSTRLLVLSVYLQVMQLFKAIFAAARRLLDAIPRAVLDAFTFEPGLPIAGMDMGATPGLLYVKIVVQVVLHQIEGMEALLGLPGEYRLSWSAPWGRSSIITTTGGGGGGGGGGRGGIFGEPDADALLQSVLAGGSPGLGGGGGGVVPVQSLRDDLAKVLGNM